MESEKMQSTRIYSPSKKNHVHYKIDNMFLKEPQIKIEKIENGSYNLISMNTENAFTGEQKKSVLISPNNQRQHQFKKVTDENVKAAAEILAVLLDSPQKVHKAKSSPSKKKNKGLNDLNSPQKTVLSNSSKRKDNVLNNMKLLENKSKEVKEDSEKLRDIDIAEMLLDSDEDDCNDFEKKIKKCHKQKDFKKNMKMNDGNSQTNNKMIFNESELDRFPALLRKDRVDELSVTRSPHFKINSSPKVDGNRQYYNDSPSKLFCKNNVRRSLASELESLQTDRTLGKTFKLKLKRKASSPLDDIPACKERRTESPSASPLNGKLESRGLRCREKIKLPKWRLHEEEITVKSSNNKSSPATPKIKTNVDCSPSNNTSPKIAKRSFSKSDKERGDCYVKITSSPELIKSAAEIFHILSSPGNKNISESKTFNMETPSSSKGSFAEKLVKGKSSSHKSGSKLSTDNVSEFQHKKKNHVSSATSSPNLKPTCSKISSAEIQTPKNNEMSDFLSECNQNVVKNNDSSLTLTTKRCEKKFSPLHTPSKVKNNVTPKLSDKNQKKKSQHHNENKKDVVSEGPSLSKKSLKALDKCPAIKNDTSQASNSSTSLEDARTQLLASTVPQSLPCRNKEFNNIYNFILRKIEDLAGGCMYISGVPGTGKTATVHAVIKKLQLEAKQNDLPDFDFVEVNGLRLTEPRQAYTRMWQTLTGQRLTPEQAQRSLDKKYSSVSKKTTVLLVDELDYLCNRRQDVIYNILDWPTKQGSALVILTIANTMDLPERTLKGKVTSRMGLTRLVFQPYTHHQLREIVLNRLSGNSSFHPDAVQLVARKVAAVSGDARRALDICRRATELVDSSGVVTIRNVEQALSQIFTGPRICAIRSCSVMSQLVLRSLRDETLRTGVDESNVGKVYQHLGNICTLEGLDKPTTGDVLSIATALENLGLIVAEKGRPDLMRKLSLNVSSDDIHYALSC